MDQKLKCIDCGNLFVWTTGEQEFYEKYDFLPPKRCKLCRKKRNYFKNKDQRSNVIKE